MDKGEVRAMKKSDYYHVRLLERLRILFPEFTNGQIKHAANRVGHVIRKHKGDNYSVDISRNAYQDNQGYWSYYKTNACGLDIYVAILTD